MIREAALRAQVPLAPSQVRFGVERHSSLFEHHVQEPHLAQLYAFLFALRPVQRSKMVSSTNAPHQQGQLKLNLARDHKGVREVRETPSLPRNALELLPVVQCKNKKSAAQLPP